eukprot:5827161-Karenia_brevis.AAC.1
MRSLGFGGAGLQRAEHVAAAAHLASLLVARPKLEDLAVALGTADLLSRELIMSDIDALIMEARSLVSGRLPTHSRESVDLLMNQARTRADRDWTAVRAGTHVVQELAPRIGRPDSATQGTAGPPNAIPRACE